jgi:arylsulfatase A-like enzyme
MRSTNSPDVPSDHELMLKSGRCKEAVQGYLAAITYVDGQIGRVLDALDRSRYHDNTIVMLFGDHGWSLGEKQHWRKFALWEKPRTADWRYIRYAEGGEELYDERSDPDEWRNVAADRKHDTLKAQLATAFP